MKLLYVLPLLWLEIVTALGDQNLRGLSAFKIVPYIECNKPCMNDIGTCTRRCAFDSSDDIMCKNGKLPKKCEQCCNEVGDKEEEEGGITLINNEGLVSIKDIKCDKSCMNGIDKCRKRCQVGSTGGVSCRNGLPRKCERKCCGPAWNPSGSSESATRITGTLKPVPDIICSAKCMETIKACKTCQLDLDYNLICIDGELPDLCGGICCERDDNSPYDGLEILGDMSCSHKCMVSREVCSQNCVVMRPRKDDHGADAYNAYHYFGSSSNPDEGNGYCIEGKLPSECSDCCSY